VFSEKPSVLAVLLIGCHELKLKKAFRDYRYTLQGIPDLCVLRTGFDEYGKFVIQVAG